MQIHRIRRVNIFVIFLIGMICGLLVTNTFGDVGLTIDNLNNYGVPLYEEQLKSGLSMAGTTDQLMKVLPKGYKRFAAIDSTGKNVYIQEQIDGFPVYVPAKYDLDEYLRFSRQHHLMLIWQKYKVNHISGDPDADKRGGGLAIDIPVKIKSKAFQTIFGGDRVGLSVTGSITINGGFRHEKRSQVRTAINRGSDYNFKMEQTQQFRVTGNVGDKVKVSVDQDSERPFDFENTIKLNYDGYDDEIIKKIEAGNISLSLPATRFVSFSGKNSGLFGLKAEMQVGDLNMTMIASQEKGENKKLTYSGGAQEGVQQIKDSNYMKGVYFFLDQFYRDKYFPLENGQHEYDLNYTIADIEVYISTTEQDPKRIWGFAAADPARIMDDEFEVTREHVEGYWARLEKTEYFVENDLGYIRLNTYAGDEKMLAVAYRDSSNNVYGEIDFSTMEGDSIIHLKLIKPKDPRPSDSTWDLMFRHVYNLGGRDIEEDGFELKIFHTPPSGDDQETIQTDEGIKSFLHVFGLDNVDETGAPIPDNKIDNNSNIRRLGMGELEFPSLRPFDDVDNPYYDALKIGNPNKLVRAMYDTTNQSEITRDSKFYIEVKSKSRSSTMQLGWNVIEGSEEVRLNGAPLQKGTDYIIDYYSGTLTVLNQNATSPSADLEVTYQRNELFQLEKKTLLGLRAEYDLWENSFIGGTFLYLNQRTLDQKVRVGKGPMRNLIWDLNTKLSFKPNFLTKIVDALPLIQTKQPSTLNFEGEIAQILPNPNTLNNERTNDKDGVAYIDDFEAAKKITPLGVIQGGWTQSSTPVQKSLLDIGRMYWYNPYNMVYIQDIWPNREVNANTPQTVHVLDLVFTPSNSIDDIKDSWFGIMRPLSSGYADQSDSKFIEFWINGNSGNVHLDLGQISEDVVPNGKLDTEDEMINGIRNGLLDPGEDVGLDGMAGEDPNDYWDINGNGKRDFGEPSSFDDWAYRQDYYEKSNGTEGNENNVNGRIPDTEDINGNGSLDQINSYFEYSFSLDKDHPDAEKYIRGANEESRWYLYRIPLAEPDTVVGTPDMTRLEFARIWVDGLPAQAKIRIAEINLVGNDWKEKGTASVRDSIIVDYDEKDDKTVVATIINTHDNAEEYDPPPGVRGVRDRITRVEAKEQSLVIRINELESKHQGILQKTFYQAENYIHYRKMKMFIHGGDKLGTNFPELGGDPKIILSLRLGANEQNYYEIIQPVYEGWEGNNMEVDLSELTNFKLNPDTTYFVNNQEIRERRFDEYRIWRIVGDPSLTNVKQLVLGVENITDLPFNGEVWVNELRLSEVYKDKGMAMRARVDLKVADLFNVNAEIDRQDADFHNINNRFGTGDNQVSYNINSGFQFHKFFPRSWGLSLPISFNYKSSKSTPKYVSGSDILVTSSTPDTTLEKIRRQSESYGYGISFRKTTKSNNFFIKNSIDNISLSFNGAQSTSSDSRTEKQTRETYSANVSYNLNFDAKAHFRPFFWLDKIPVAKKMGELKYFYWPTKLDIKASGTQTKSYSLTRTGLENSSRPFSISRSAQTGYRPFSDLSFDFSRTHKSDMTQIERPKDELLKGKFGELTNVDQNTSAKFNPKIFKWLTTNFSYSSNFQWSNNLQLKSTGTGRSASNNGTVSGNFTFDPDKLIKSFMGSDNRKTPRRKPGSNNAAGEQEDKKKKISLLAPFKLFFSGIDFITRNIQPISINYSKRDNKSYSALEEGMPSWDFMLGFADSTGLGLVENVGTNRNSFRNSENLSLQSGFKIMKNIDVTLRFSSDNSRNQTTQITGDQSFSAYKIAEDQQPIPFPEWSVRWTGVEKIPIIKDWTKRVNFDHSFTGKSTEAWQNDESNITRKSYNASFRPLLGMNITFKNDISATLRYNLSNTFEENVLGGSGGRRSTNSEFSAQAKYARSGGFRIPIPVWPFKNKEIKNDMDFSFAFSMSSNVDEQNVQGGKWEEMNKTAKWSLKPQLTYRFSANVSGGVHFEYGKNESKRMGKTSFQDFGLNVRIDIRGR